MVRFTLVNRNDGSSETVEMPRRGEFVKDGQRHLAKPDKTACENLMGLIRERTKLGGTGGCLAS